MTAAGEISNDRNPKFPVGMRVLAVDDDPTCLKLLDTLLSKCQYHVTTSGQAVTALKMLRENKNMFDLVISDVCMPDMNGFKLLELVGLEMDLPVIMLSAHGDTEHVMKGISHGACDYLLKPVRIEELRNIWQHVIRRKKIDIKDQKSFDQTQDDNVEDFTKAAEAYQNDKISRKRKDKNGDEYEEHDQDGDHNEDPSWQKKPRLVWTPELHRLFVAAVNQLGIDKAVPKRILETMNVENVTRENVASHLQKYRVSLKRMSEEASHQANMASVLRRADSSYLRGGYVNGFGDLHSSGMWGQIQNSAFGSFPQGGVLGRLNSPGLCILGLSSSGIQRDRPQTNLTTLGTGVSNLQSRVQHENQNGNILQGVPLSLGLDQLQLNQNNSHIGELSVCSNESNIYANSNVFPNSKTVVGSSIKSFSDVQNNPVAVENHLQSTQKDVVPGNHYSVLSNTLNSECSQSLDYKRFDDTWLDANKSSMNLPNTCTSDYFNQSVQRNVRLIPTVPVQLGTIAHARLSDQRSDLQRQFALVSSSASQNMNLTQKRHSGNWDGYKSPMSNMINSSIDYSISPQYDTGLMGQRLDSGSMGSYQKHDGSLARQSNLLDPMLLQHNKVEQPAAQATTELNYGSLMGKWNPNSSYAHSKADSLEDLVAVMMKEEECMLNTNGGGEFGIGCFNTEDLERSLVLVPLH